MSWFNKKNTQDDLLGDDTTVDTNARSPLRWGLMILIIGFGGFVLWAALAPLDAGVPADATVQVFGNRKVVQHLEGGTVEDIYVREGSKVTAGETVVRLNPTRALAEQGVITAQFIIAKATEARLRAERDDLPEIVYEDSFMERFRDDPRFIEARKSQESLFRTRREALEGEIAILQENLRGTQEQLEGLTEVQDSRKSQITFINRELTGVRQLAKEGYLPRNRMLELERNAAQLQAALSNDIVEAGRARNQIAELKLRIMQRRQDYQKEVQSLLSDIQKEASALEDRLDALDYTVRETNIRAPITGTVQALQVHTVGGVIGPGTVLMEVVPNDAKYIVEAKVPVQSIDKVHPGLDVEITFPAFSVAQTPNIPGRVITISPDRLVDEATNMPYYKAQVEITAEGVNLLAGNEVRPGMPASVLIRTGERTMLSYLFKPFLDRMHSSFREQ